MRKMVRKDGSFEPHRQKKKAKPKELKIRLSLEFEGERGMNEFASVLRVLNENGHQEKVQLAVKEIIKSAKENGAAVPAELEAFANGRAANS